MSRGHRPGSDGAGDDCAGPALEDGDLGALGPLAVTEKELELLEAAHRRLLGDEAVLGPATERGRDPAEEGAAAEAGLSLVLRGLLDAHGELPEDDGPAMLLVTMLDVRLAAERVLVVERVVAGAGPTGAPGRDEGGDGRGVLCGTRLVHLLEDGACVEDVLPDGSRQLHLLLDPEDLAPWVTGVTVPPDATAGSGPAVAVRPDRPEEIALLLGRPTALVELSVLPSGDAAPSITADRDASPAHHLLALGPSGCWLTRVDPGRSLPERVVFGPVDPGWVERWVRWARSAADLPATDPSAAVEGPGERGGQGTMAG